MSLYVGDRLVRSMDTRIPDGHLRIVTYARCIDTSDSPDDEHMVARNM